MPHHQVLENLKNLTDKRLTIGNVWSYSDNCGCVLGSCLPCLPEFKRLSSGSNTIQTNFRFGFKDLQGLTLDEAVALELFNDTFGGHSFADFTREARLEAQKALYQTMLAHLEQKVAEETSSVV